MKNMRAAFINKNITKIFLRIYFTIYVFSSLTYAQPAAITTVPDKNEPTARDNTAIRIMPLGDSITYGILNSNWNPNNPTERGFRGTLDSLLKSSGYNFDFVGSLQTGDTLNPLFDRDHEGHPGWAAGLPAYWGSLDTALTRFLNLNYPDIVLLHIGTNDISEPPGIYFKTADQVAEAVKNLLNSIYTFNPDIITVVAKIIDRDDSHHQKTLDFNNALELKINSLPSERRSKIILVDMFNALGNWNPTYFEDQIHPNPDGYKRMSELWYSALANILPAPQILADIKVFLEGPYNSGTMNTALNSKGYLQLFASEQPYNGPPWNYAGTESVDSVFFQNNRSMVDWVLVELRNKENPCLIESVRTGFLKEDGRIVDTDGYSNLKFTGLLHDNYYIAVKHRNHLPVMSANPVVLTDNLLSYDFTADTSSLFGGSFAVKKLDAAIPSVWGMITSDGNADGFINAVDLNLVWRPENGFDNYSNADYNLDGYVNAVDKNLLWRLNNGLDSELPVN